MTLALVLLGGIAVFGVVLAARFGEACSWRRSLVAYRLMLPANLTADDVAAWLGGIAASTHAPRLSLLPYPPLALEVVASHRGIAHYLLAPEKMRLTMLSGLRAAMPGARLEEMPNYLTTRPHLRTAAEAVLTSQRRPLATERAEATSTALRAALQPLSADETVVLQWILAGAGTPRPVRQPKRSVDNAALPWWLEADSPRDADEVRAERLKQREPLLLGTLRLAVQADTPAKTYAVFGRVWGTLRGLNTAGVLVVRRWWLWPSWAAERLHTLAIPVTRWPVLINAREAVGLLGLPLGGVQLPGLPRTAARQLPPAVHMPMLGTVIGRSTYPGMTERPLALHVRDRLRHSWIIGPTGVGKSTLLANLIVQDVRAGRGVAVIDPKGDLIADVLDRVPDERRDDVVIIDPSATDRPVGVNVLETSHGEHARELAVDHLVYLMSNLWRSSFGPRTADVLRNALLTLTHTKAADGTANTLIELPEILLNPSFRAFATGQPSVPESVRPFWYAYEQMSDGERAQVIGPSLNKLRSFTTRTAMRLMLGQSQGIRLDELFTRRRIVLVSLAKGVLGTDTTALIGSLIVAGLWQATLERVTVPHEYRHPVFLYLDEFQDFLRLPIDLADMLAQARGLGVGLVLAHQYLGQLTEEVKTAVLGTARTKIAFQVDFDDARALANRFAPLTHDDLTGLATYEIAMLPCVEGSTLGPVTGTTLPLPPGTTDGPVLARLSRERFGVPRADVEAALRSRIEVGTTAARLGRLPREGRA